jgi:2-keto-4-pentenoate hydratase
MRIDGRVLILAAAMVLQPASVWARCPDDDAIRTLAWDILSIRPARVPILTAMDDAYCAQGKLVTLLQAHWGAPVGYKAGLTGSAVQERFGVREPVRGVLLAGMLLEPGTPVRADFGTRPLFEADLVVVVGSAAINQAGTYEEILANLSELRPFIELADLMVADPGALSAAQIAAINVGVRKGILGEPIPMDSTTDLIAALSSMRVRVTDQHGRTLSTADGSSILGHPLNAVLWLRDSGLVLREGDLLSLGAFGSFLIPEPGLTATVTYGGLPGNPRISVRFE